MKSITVKKGRFKGEVFEMEADIEDMPGGNMGLPFLASQGNFAARNALQIDEYTFMDAPFYYGKIGSLGYIISGKDLGI